MDHRLLLAHQAAVAPCTLALELSSRWNFHLLASHKLLIPVEISPGHSLSSSGSSAELIGWAGSREGMKGCSPRNSGMMLTTSTPPWRAPAAHGQWENPSEAQGKCVWTH